MYLNPQSSAVAKRQSIEVKIVTSLIDELLAYFQIRVDDGETLSPLSNDKQTIIDAVMNTDDDTLYVFNSDRDSAIGWIRLVYGNDGWDVISDYTTNLEKYFPKTLALIEKEGN